MAQIFIICSHFLCNLHFCIFFQLSSLYSCLYGYDSNLKLRSLIIFRLFLSRRWTKRVIVKWSISWIGNRQLHATGSKLKACCKLANSKFRLLEYPNTTKQQFQQILGKQKYTLKDKKNKFQKRNAIALVALKFEWSKKLFV